MTTTPPSPSAPLEENYGDISSSSGVPNEQKVPDKVVGAAAIAGGVAGLVVAGPLLGIGLAAGAAALATQHNTGGDVARASGDVVIATGERAKKLDQKHHIVEKTKKATEGFVQNAKEFEKKHHVGEKAGKGLKDGLNFLSKKLKPKESK